MGFLALALGGRGRGLSGVFISYRSIEHRCRVSACLKGMLLAAEAVEAIPVSYLAED